MEMIRNTPMPDERQLLSPKESCFKISSENCGDNPDSLFAIPPKKDSANGMNSYLIHTKGISDEIVRFFTDEGIMFEDTAQHIIFAGKDMAGVPCSALSWSMQNDTLDILPHSDVRCGFSYTGSGENLMLFSSPLDMLSFITLYQKDWEKRHYLVVHSDHTLIQYLADHQIVQRVFLCLGADEDSFTACNQLMSAIPEHLTVDRLVPVRNGWNRVLLDKETLSEYFQLYKMRTVWIEPPVKMIRMGDVRQTDVYWLWKPYIPFGKLSMLQGDPGGGKTHSALNWIAACTTGKLLPGMIQPLEPFNVIYQTAEDGLGDTIKPRLIKAGADLNRVFVIDDTDQQLTLSDDRIEKAIIQNQARLLIIDPIQAYLGPGVDMNRANEVRPIFMRLSQVAERTGCAIVMIGHLNKAAGMQSLHRGLGSIDIAAAVRSVMFIGKLKNDPNVRVLTHEKSSLAEAGPSLAFSINDEEGVSWIGEYEISSDEMLSGSEPRRENKTEAATALIRTMLSGNRQVYSDEIDKAALEKGIPSRTVRMAKKAMGSELRYRYTEGHRKLYWLEDTD